MSHHKSRAKDRGVLVIGLGRFGSSLALELMNHGWEVLAVDTNPRRVQHFADALTHTAVTDATDEESLRQVGAEQFTRAVVAIGTHLEESILSTSLLVDMEIDLIWAKAISRRHGRILEQVGAHRVVLPEYDMGERIAHLMSGRILDYVELEEGFSLIKTPTPRRLQGVPLGESGIRREYGITVVSVKHSGQPFTYATQQTVLDSGDLIVVAGKTKDVERFSGLK